MVHHLEEEPPFHQQVGWDTEAIPGGLQFYYDTDGDGGWDVAFSHVVIGPVVGGNCYEDHPSDPTTFMFTNCPDDNPVGFLLIKDPWFMRVRNANWKSLTKKTFGSSHHE